MKQYLFRITQKIDALTLRERAITFAMAALALVTLVNLLMIDPQFAKQKQLSQGVAQEQQKIATLQADIQQRVKTGTSDPDAANRERLRQLTQKSVEMNDQLRQMQKTLVVSGKMAALLEDILKRHGKLRLVSLQTLAPTDLNETTSDAADTATGDKPAGAAKEKQEHSASLGAVYRHGVEMTVQGSYPDMLNYMTELEAMPWQLFWGKARMSVNTYPEATLTLTLFTLSLDKKWLDL